MQIIPIDSITKDIPQEFFNLRTTSQQTEANNKFIAEGPEVVLRHLMSMHVVESLLIDEKQFYELKQFIEEKFQVTPFPIFICSKNLISEIIGFKVHQGVLSLGVKPLKKALTEINFPAIAFNGLVNAENVGGIIRTAQAFSVKTFIVDRETCDPWIRRCVRVSMGTMFSSDIFYCENLLIFFSDLKIYKDDLRIVSLEQDERAISIYKNESIKEFDILVLGSEKGGVDKQVLDSCSDIYEIPISKNALNSLNVNCALSAFLAIRELKLEK